MDLTGSANDLDRLDPETWSVLVQHPDASRVFPADIGISFRRLWDHRTTV